jgi:hypothetical protein
MAANTRKMHLNPRKKRAPLFVSTAYVIPNRPLIAKFGLKSQQL